MLDFLLNTFLTPIKLFFFPSTRIYWLYLGVSFLFAILFIRKKYFSNRRYRLIELFHKTLEPRIIFHKSSIVDYKYFLINTILFSLLFGLMVLSVQQITARTLDVLFKYFSRPQIPYEFGIFENLLYTFFFWLCMDFGRFLAHYLMHKNKYLWEFHKFHHSANILNPLTDYRAHPIEAILLNSFAAFFSGIFSALIIFIFPHGTMIIEIFDIPWGIFFFNLYANLRHTHIWIEFRGVFKYILISPALHQIHHSSQERHIDKNFGVAFAFWDLLFSSLYIPPQKEILRMGLPKEKSEDYQNIFDIYFLPFKKIFMLVFKNKIQ